MLEKKEELASTANTDDSTPLHGAIWSIFAALKQNYPIDHKLNEFIQLNKLKELKNYFTIVLLLLENGADPKAINNNGDIAYNLNNLQSHYKNEGNIVHFIRNLPITSEQRIKLGLNSFEADDDSKLGSMQHLLWLISNNSTHANVHWNDFLNIDKNVQKFGTITYKLSPKSELLSLLKFK